MDAIGLRIDFRLTPFQDLIKELEAGKFQMYFGGYGGIPSGYAQLMQLYGKEPPSVNTSRFKSAEYDRAMEEYLRSPARRRADRGRAPDVGDRAHVRPDHPDDLPPRERLRAAVDCWAFVRSCSRPTGSTSTSTSRASGRPSGK